MVKVISAATLQCHSFHLMKLNIRFAKSFVESHSSLTILIDQPKGQHAICSSVDVLIAWEFLVRALTGFEVPPSVWLETFSTRLIRGQVA